MTRRNSIGGSVYVYELDETFEDPFALAERYRSDILDVVHALQGQQSTFHGMHLEWKNNIRPYLWKPIMITETGEIFPSMTHLAYRFGITKGRISQVMKEDVPMINGQHLTYVKE